MMGIGCTCLTAELRLVGGCPGHVDADDDHEGAAGACAGWVGSLNGAKSQDGAVACQQRASAEDEHEVRHA